MDASELDAILSAWSRDIGLLEDVPDEAVTVAVHWKHDWREMLSDSCGEVLSLTAGEGCEGLAALDLDYRSTKNERCVNLVLLGKSPRAFCGGYGEIGTCLVVRAVERSVELGLAGVVRIPVALCPEELDKNPSRLYARLGFADTGLVAVSEGYLDMEISADSAEKLLRDMRS